MIDQRAPSELVLAPIPTAPAPSPTSVEGLALPQTPSVPTPGVSPAVTRIPTAPTLPDDPTHLTALVARLATELYGVNGAGIGAAPELAPSASAEPATHPTPPAPGSLPTPPSAPPAIAATGAPPAASPSPPSAAPLSPLPPEGGGKGPGVGGLPTGPGVGAQPATPSPSANPFAVEPRFDGVLEQLAGLAAPDFSVPLIDGVHAAPAQPEPSSPPLPPEGGGKGPGVGGLPTQPGVGGLPASIEPQLPTSREVLGPLPPELGLDLSRGSGFDAYALREEFPILRERVHGKRLVWLDNAATTQKPKTVIDRLVRYYEHENSNIHRAAHALAARATDAYEGARESVRRFLNARSVKEVVFVRGATEGINLVAQSWGRRNVEPGDEIIITWLEHHANIVPWQLLAKEKGARLRVAPVDDRGQIQLDEYEKLFSSKTKLVALPQVSNALGTITPAKAMVEIAHRHGVPVLVDGAQSVSHMRVDLQALDADFFVFSGHKVFAPTGIGAVVAKEEILEHTPPWQGGGNMIQDVTFERTLFHGPPARFEAGTGNIADAVGLGAALDWLTRVGIDNVDRHEHDLLVYGTEKLCRIPGLTIIGTAKEKAGVLSFVIDGRSTADVATYLDKEGIAVRGGHHCAQPILRRFGKESTVRASLAPYNVREDLDALVEALEKLVSGQAR